MKTLTAFSLFTAVAVLAASCSKGGAEVPPEPPEPPGPPAEEKIEIKINPGIDAARATDHGFESGDCIGLYVVNYNGTAPGTLASAGNHVDNMRFRYDGTWTPDSPVYWKDETTHADFYLYYPYAPVTDVRAYSFDVRPDQSAEAAYKASDLLAGKALDVAPTEEAILLPASHVMSRAEISLSAGAGFTPETLAAAAVSVRINGVKCGSVVDLSTGTATATGDATTETSFETGDVVGLFVSESGRPLEIAGNTVNNEALTYTGAAWRPSRQLDWDAGTYNAYAYYPRAAEVSSIADFPFEVSADQRGVDSYGASDFLYASATGLTASREPVAMRVRRYRPKARQRRQPPTRRRPCAQHRKRNSPQEGYVKNRHYDTRGISFEAGSGTRYVGNYAFDGTALADLYAGATVPPFVAAEALVNGSTTLPQTCVLHVPAGCKKIYRNHKNWGLFERIEEYKP